MVETDGIGQKSAERLPAAKPDLTFLVTDHAKSMRGTDLGTVFGGAGEYADDLVEPSQTVGLRRFPGGPVLRMEKDSPFLVTPIQRAVKEKEAPAFR